MGDGCAKLIGGALALIFAVALALQGLAYGGMIFIIGIEYLALAFTWVGAGSPVIGWSLLGILAGGGAGLLIGLNRAGRDLKPVGMAGSGFALGILLLLLGVNAAKSYDFGTPVAEDATTTSPTEKEASPQFAVQIDTERLNVREGPSGSSDVLATASEGSQLDVLDTRGDWQQVRVRTDDGQQRKGWIHSDYTRRAGRSVEQVERRASNEPLASTSGNDRSEAADDASGTDETSNTEEDTDEEGPKIENPLKRLAERRREEREEEKEESVPAEIISVDVPPELTVEERGAFTATINEGEATPPISSNWEFGDGTTDDGLVVSHAYDEPGTYTVRYRASNDGGAEATSATVTVEAKSRSPRSFRPGARTSVSVQDYRFEVAVLRGRASRTNDGRTRLALDVQQKSVNYDGEWIQWDHILRESYLSAGNQRHEVKRAASENLGKGSVSPGSARTGTLIFEIDRSLEELNRPTLYFAYYPYDNAQFARIPFSVE